MVTFSMCLGVMYSAENDVCGITLSLSTPGKLKNIPDYGGNTTYDLWNASRGQANFSAYSVWMWS